MLRSCTAPLLLLALACGQSRSEDTNAPPGQADPIRAAAEAIGGKVKDPVDPARMGELLPDEFAGLPRTDLKQQKSGAAGVVMTNVIGRYEADARRITISVSDIGGLGGMGTMGAAAWAMSEFDRTTATGYERTTRFEGYKAMESLSRTGGRVDAELSLVVADRFVIQIKGRGVDMDAVKAAARSLALDQLARARVTRLHRMVLFGWAGLPALLSSRAGAQEIPRADRDGLLRRVSGPERSVALVSRHALEIDARITDLVVAVGQRFKIRFRIPKAADPADALRDLCARCGSEALLAAGYDRLEMQLRSLRGIAEGRDPFQADQVQTLVQRVTLLAAALKGYALLEAIDFRTGGKVRPGGVEGPAGTIPDWPGAAALLGGTGDDIADHIARMMDRRRQAEAVGLEYPNADLGWLVPCLRDCGH